MALALTTITALSSASPFVKRQSGLPVCGGSIAQCCSVDVLGVLDLDCENSKTNVRYAATHSASFCSLVDRRLLYANRS